MVQLAFEYKTSCVLTSGTSPPSLYSSRRRQVKQNAYENGGPAKTVCDNVLVRSGRRESEADDAVCRVFNIAD